MKHLIFWKEIIKLIKEAKITDTRFKSVTFDRGMATRWAPSQTGNVSMIQNLSIEAGAQGKYSYVANNQVEFVLNRNPKVITFNNL